MNTKDMTQLLPTLEEFDPLAMAKRSIEARRKKDGEYIKASRVQQLTDMIEALGRHTEYRDRDYYEMQTIGRVLEYLQEWIKGEHDDDDVLMLIKITLMAEVDMKIMRQRIADGEVKQ